MKRKVISTVIAACMVVGTMAGFGTSVNAATSNSEDSGEKITLKLFHNWINVDEAPYFEDIAEEFESTHPNVDIVVENVGDPDYNPMFVLVIWILIISLNLRLCLVQMMLLIFSFHGAVNLHISLQEREVHWI